MTWGSAAALPCAWVIVTHYHVTGLLVASALVFVIGVWAANGYMRQSGTHDPGPVVIDEVVGQWLVLCMVPQNLAWYATGFVVFRVFDIVKPWPIKQMDARIGGGFGVMIDDVGAAVYGVGVLWLAQYFLEHVR